MLKSSPKTSVSKMFLSRLFVFFLLFCKGVFAFAKQNDVFDAAPNDQVVNTIKRFHQHPQEVIASLQQRLSDDAAQAERAELCYLLSYGYMKLGNLSKSQQYLTQALDNIQVEQQSLLYHRLLLHKAQLLNSLNKGEKALPYLEKVYDWAEKNGVTQLYIGAQMTQGIINLALDNPEQALEALIAAYISASNHDTQIPAAHISGLVADAYQSMDEYERGLEYLYEALGFAKEHDNQINQQRLHLLLARAYYALGDDNVGDDHLTSANDIALKLDDDQALAAVLLLRGEQRIKQQKFDVATSDFENALELLNRLNKQGNYFSVYYDLALALYHTDRLDEAEVMLARELSLLSQTQSDERINGLALMANIYYAQGDFEQAFLAEKEVRALEQKRATALNAEKLYKMQVLFDVDKKVLENDRLREANALQEQQYNVVKQREYFLIVLLFLLFSICVLLLALKRRRKIYHKHLEYLANTDVLTGLKNRQYTMRALELQHHLLEQKGGVLSVAMLDIDHFKSINDTWGHLMGDKVLASFGKHALQVFRQSDELGRIGGEEFLFIFPDTPAESACVALNKFRDALSFVGAELLGEDRVLTVSIGVGEVSASNPVLQEIERIDAALYRAKNLGRDQIILAKDN